MASKLIVVLGVTGMQGGSVAKSFAKDPLWKVRGVTRDPYKPHSVELSASGIEIVAGDMDDPLSLASAFDGATAIFAVTDFWANFRAVLSKDRSPNQTILEEAAEAEFQQGKNIADAAALRVGKGLTHFIFSTLSATKSLSGGKYPGVYHFDSKAKISSYIKKQLEELNVLTSEILVGFYLNNWKVLPLFGPQKQADGTIVLRTPSSPTAIHPHIHIGPDLGIIAHALIRLAPGKKVLGARALISYQDYIKLWSSTTQFEVRYEQLSIEALAAEIPGGVGQELGEMFAYSAEFGYDGGEENILRPVDIGADLGSLEDYFKEEDWSPLINT